MKSNSFLEEAVSLCESILEVTPPNGEWGIINLVKKLMKDGDDTFFKSSKYSELPIGFYFAFDQIAEYLQGSEVFLGIDNSGMWFKRIAKFCYNTEKEEWPNKEKQILMRLTYLATKKGWINKGIKIDELWETIDVDIDVFENTAHEVWTDYFSSGVDTTWANYGPDNTTHLVALYDRSAMEKFVNKHRGYTPHFDVQTESLRFLGEVVEFSGEHSKVARALIENVNSIVSWEDLCLLDGVKYNDEVKLLGNATNVHDPLRGKFKYIKAKIYANPILTKNLHLLEHGGFGMFVNQSTK